MDTSPHVSSPLAASVAPPALPKPAPPLSKLLITSERSDAVYEKDLSSPFWADVEKMQPGAFVKYESIDKEWHVFIVQEGPRYGRLEMDNAIGLSVVVRRVSTGKVFIMPPNRLRSCGSTFASRDGTKVRRGEGGWR